MSMKTLLSNATAKALLISVAGACILAAAPVTAASAATLSDLYRSQFVVRNCRFDFNHFATAHFATCSIQGNTFVCHLVNARR